MAQSEKLNFWIRDGSCDIKIPFDCFTAASNGDLSFFTKYMVGTTEHFSAVNKSGWTPLMYACAKGHTLLVSYLIMCGVRTVSTAKSRVTPLMLAITSGDLPTVQCVFNLVDLEIRDYRSWTPLFYAVYFLQEKCVQFLLSKGANVNVTDFQNETPLILAVKSGSESMVKLLIPTATNLDVVSFRNESATMLAKESKNPKIREMVLNHREAVLSSGGNISLEDDPTPRNKFLFPNRNNLPNQSPSPAKSPKTRSFLGLKMSKSFSYSPNGGGRICQSRSQSNSPNRECRDSGKVPFWKMCLNASPIASGGDCDVETLLSSLGLEKYWPIFRDEEVDFETLLTFNEENLREIGIAQFGPRMKIMSAIVHLRMYHRR